VVDGLKGLGDGGVLDIKIAASCSGAIPSFLIIGSQRVAAY